MVSIQTFFSFPLENSADKSFLLCFQCSPSTPKRELPIEPPKFTLLLFVNTGKCLMKASFSHFGSMTISVGEVPSNVLPCKNKFKSRYISGQDMEYKWTIKTSSIYAYAFLQSCFDTAVHFLSILERPRPTSKNIKHLPFALAPLTHLSTPPISI